MATKTKTGTRYQQNDPRGWKVVDRTGKTVANGFQSFADARKEIKQFAADAAAMPGYGPAVVPLILRGTFFAVAN